MELPEESTEWIHNKTGASYLVRMVGNEKADRKDWSPITVCYMDDNGDKWTRPLDEWLKNYTPVKLERCSLCQNFHHPLCGHKTS